MTTALISHTFTVQDIAFIGTPTSSPVFNELDYHGSLLGVLRLPEEKNNLYKKRLLDTYVNRANSSYIGLVNGITRELGLNFFKPMSISVRDSIDSSLSPRVEFKDNNIYIYSDSLTSDLEMTIDRGNSSNPEYLIGGLVDRINTSLYFEASLEEETYRFKRSDTIINQSSSKLVIAQQLNASRVNHLGIANIDRGSLIFSDLRTFRSEVDDLSLVSSTGTYYVDYQLGVITSFLITNDSSVVQYTYRENVFQPKASPVIIRSLNSPEFAQTLFNQIQQSNNGFSSGNVTEKGAAIINELLSVVPMYWGE